MDCPKCGEPVETAIEFCGNCGQPLVSTVQVPTNTTNVQARVADADRAITPPLGTSAAPIARRGLSKAVTGLVLALLAIPASLIPILGLVLGVAGFILGTISRQYYKKAVSLLAIIIGGLAIALSLAMWTYSATHP